MTIYIYLLYILLCFRFIFIFIMNFYTKEHNKNPLSNYEYNALKLYWSLYTIIYNEQKKNIFQSYNNLYFHMINNELQKNNLDIYDKRFNYLQCFNYYKQVYQ